MKDSKALDSPKLGTRSSSGMSLVWSPCACIIGVRVLGLPLSFVA